MMFMPHFIKNWFIKKQFSYFIKFEVSFAVLPIQKIDPIQNQIYLLNSSSRLMK